MNLFRAQRCVPEQIFVQMRQVSFGIFDRTDSLIYLHKLHGIPRDFLVHRALGASTMVCCRRLKLLRSATSSNRSTGLCCNKNSGRAGH
ncbi:MAG TPA: hypothetical protein VE422_43505 [Terriglobia bacterium]|nr:hypothetical protein [Terriglobia bacterium]